MAPGEFRRQEQKCTVIEKVVSSNSAAWRHFVTLRVLTLW
jgi:hypothetical protein